MTTLLTVDLPDSLVQEMEVSARKQQRSVTDMARELILSGWHSLPQLPEDVEVELATFTNLSDEVLWLLARSALTTTEQEELATLNYQAKRRTLTDEELVNQKALLAAYNRMIVRRAQAALLLQSRGYDMSDPHVLQPS
jgi:hypothetical protein